MQARNTIRSDQIRSVLSRVEINTVPTRHCSTTIHTRVMKHPNRLSHSIACHAWYQVEKTVVRVRIRPKSAFCTIRASPSCRCRCYSLSANCPRVRAESKQVHLHQTQRDLMHNNDPRREIRTTARSVVTQSGLLRFKLSRTARERRSLHR
jgi:hypothetical protein